MQDGVCEIAHVIGGVATGGVCVRDIQKRRQKRHYTVSQKSSHFLTVCNFVIS